MRLKTSEHVKHLTIYLNFTVCSNGPVWPDDPIYQLVHSLGPIRHDMDGQLHRRAPILTITLYRFVCLSLQEYSNLEMWDVSWWPCATFMVSMKVSLMAQVTNLWSVYIFILWSNFYVLLPSLPQKFTTNQSPVLWNILTVTKMFHAGGRVVSW